LFNTRPKQLVALADRQETARDLRSFLVAVAAGDSENSKANRIKVLKSPKNLFDGSPKK
jgi:hypothetical protein